MSYKIVIFAVAVIGSQVSAQLQGGILRPFTTGFSNGFAEVAKPFIQFGQSVMAPANDYISGQRFPYFQQVMTYPSKIPQAQGNIYEGIDAATSGFPGANYFQAVRPQVMKPQNQFYQIPNQPAFVRPIRPLPAVVDESIEMYRPSNLLIKPEIPEVPEAPKVPKVPEVPKVPKIDELDAGFAGPSAQIIKDNE